MKEGLEGWVRLGGRRFPRVKFLEGEDVGLEENADGVCKDLVIGIWKFSNALDFLTLLDAVEEHFRQIGGGHWALEQGAVIKQRHNIRLSIRILELVEDYVDGHCRIPPRKGWGVRNLELGGNIHFKHAEARPGDVLV
jgi:hypothetical protein